MLETTVSSLINKYLSQFVMEFRPFDFTLSIWRGVISIENIRLNRKFLQSLNLPIQFNEIACGSICLTIPWRSFFRDPISLIIKDISVLVSPNKAYTAVNVQPKVDDVKKENLNEIPDLSGIFPLIASIINHIMVKVENVHLRFESSGTPIIPPLSFGVLFDSFAITSPENTVTSGEAHLSVNLSQFATYWSPKDENMLTSLEEPKLLEGMHSIFGKDKESMSRSSMILQAFDAEVRLDGHLHIVEERQRPLEQCVTAVAETMKLTEEEITVLRCVSTLSTQGSSLQFVDSVLQAVSESSLVSDAMKQRSLQFAEAVWEQSKTPLPLLDVGVKVQPIKLTMRKSMYESILSCLDAMSGSSTTSNEDVKTETHPTAPAVTSDVTSDVTPLYQFTILSFIMYAVSAILSSATTFVAASVLLLSLPYIVFKRFWHAVLLLAVQTIYVVVSYIILRRKTTRINASLDRHLHGRDKLADVDVDLDVVSLWLGDDVTDVKELPILQLNVIGIDAFCSVGRSQLRVAASIADFQITDLVSSARKGRLRYLLCADAIDESGSICGDRIPFLDVDIIVVPPTSPTYAKSASDISVKATLGELSVVVSPAILLGIAQFVIASPQLLQRRETMPPRPVPPQAVIVAVTKEKPLPSNWDRATIAITFRMNAITAMLDTNMNNALARLKLSGILAVVTIAPSAVYVTAHVTDMVLTDCTVGRGLYPDIISTIAATDPVSHIALPFVEVNLTLYPDSRAPSYPQYAMAASCTVGIPVVTLRMRFVDEIMTYILSETIVFIVELLTSTEAPQTTAISDDSASVLDISTRDVPVQLPVVDVLMRGMVIQVPRRSSSDDAICLSIDEISVSNLAAGKVIPSDTDALNNLSVSLSGLAISSRVGDIRRTILGGLVISVKVMLAMKIDVSVYVSPVAVAISEEGILSLLSMVTDIVSERRISVETMHFDDDDEYEYEYDEEDEDDYDQHVGQDVEVHEPEQAAVEDVISRDAGLPETLHVRSVSDDSLASVASELNLVDIVPSLPVETSVTPSFGSDIHVIVSLDGFSLEFFRGDGGYSSNVHGSVMRSSVGTQSQSLLDIAVDDVDVDLFKKPSGVSVGLSVALLEVGDSRPESSICPQYRRLLRIGEANRPAFAVLCNLAEKKLGALSDICIPSGHRGEEKAWDVAVSVALGQISVLPSPFVFTLLDFIFPYMSRVLTVLAHTDFAAIIPQFDMSPLTNPDTTKKEEIPVIVKPKDSLIPKITVRASLDRVAVYVVEDLADDSCPVFVVCCGLEASVIVAPSLDITATVQLTDLRGCRSNNCLTLLPTDMHDAINPFSLRADIVIRQHCLEIAGDVVGSLLRLRIGVLDAKLIMNFVSNFLPPGGIDVTRYAIVIADKTSPDSEQTLEEEINNSGDEMSDHADDRNVEKPALAPDISDDMPDIMAIDDDAITCTENRLRLSLSVTLQEISFLVVNDALEYELPILQFVVSDVVATVNFAHNLFLHAGLTLSGDYYKPSAAVWEPYLEPWTVRGVLSHVCDAEETDPHTTMETSVDASQSVNFDKEFVDIRLEAPALLQLNVTAPLLSSLAGAAESFMKCSHSRHRNGAGFYVGIKNSTGFDMTYGVDSDSGVNRTLIALTEAQRKKVHDAEILFSGVIAVETPTRVTSQWVELHRESPHVRIYDDVTLSIDSTVVAEKNTFWTSDDIVLSDTPSDPFTAVFVLSNDVDTRVCSVKTHISRRNEWEALLQRLAADPSSPLVADTATLRDPQTTTLVSVGNQFMPTGLPAHPSLALLFLKQEYRVMPSRCLSLRVDQFTPILCDVDKECVTYCPMRRSDGTLFHAVLRNSVQSGRKVIDITSSVSVENLTGHELAACFSLPDESTDLTILDHGDVEFCPLRIAGRASLRLSTSVSTEKYQIIDVNNITARQLPSCINLSVAQKPFFVRLVVHTETVYDSFNKRSLECYCLTLVPVLSLINMLPIPLDYRVVDGSIILSESRLQEGDHMDFFGASINPSPDRKDQLVRVRVRPEGCEIFSVFDESLLPCVSKNTQSAMVYDKESEPLRLSYNAVISNIGVVTLQLFCDYWIVNRTGDDLVLSDKKDVKANHRRCPAQDVSLVKPADLSVDAAHSLKPRLFSFSHVDPSIALYIKSAHYQWSDRLGIGAIGTSGTTSLKPDEKDSAGLTEKRVYGVSVVSAPGIFAFSKVVTLCPTIILVNHTGDILRIRQDDDSSWNLLQNDTPTPYHWPNANRKQVVSFQQMASTEWTDPCKLEVGEHKLELQLSGGAASRVLCVNCVMEVAHLIVVVDFADAFNTELFHRRADGDIDYESLLDSTEVTEADQSGRALHLGVSVLLAGFGVSVVDKTQEIIYVCVRGVMAKVGLCTDGTTVLDAHLTSFQIDNSVNGSNLPVLLGSTETGEVEKDGSSYMRNLLEVALVMPRHPSVLLLEYFGLMLRPLTVAVDSRTVVALIGMLSEVSSIAESFDRSPGRQVLDRSFLLCSQAPVIDVSAQVYCYARELVLQPISIKITVCNDASAPLTGDLLPQSALFMPLQALLNTVSSVVANLQNAALQLNSFAMTDTYMSLPQLISKLVSHYVLQVVSKIYLLLGAFNILGNPAELVGNLAEGVSAFFFEPIDSLMKHPSDFVGSIGKGTEKLLKMTAFGVLDSVSKITSTASNGLASLSMSESFQADRAAGKTGIVHGVVAGVKGLVKDTMLGAQEGAAGAIKGLGKGITGLVIDPLSGAVGSVTNVVNGVKNAIYKEAMLEPVRPPRYVPLDGVLSAYSDHLAKGAAMMRAVNRGTSIELLPRERYVCHCKGDDNSRVLLLTTDRLLLLTAGGKLLWYDNYTHISVSCSGTALHVQRAASGKLEAQSTPLRSLDICETVLDTADTASIITEFAATATHLTYSSMAQYVTRLLMLLAPVEATIDSVSRLPPDLPMLSLSQVRYVSRIVMMAGESYNVDISRKHIMYKIEVKSEMVGDSCAVWSVYFRYSSLNDLHHRLTTRFNKDDLKNLRVISQSTKMFHSKSKLEMTVKEYMRVLSASSNLLASKEVEEFFKQRAFDIHWDGEEKENE